MKNCIKCNELKSIENFYKSKLSKDGLYTYCKVCHKLERKKSYKNNKEKTINQSKLWYQNNKEKIEKYRKKYYLIIKETNEKNKKQRWFDKYLQNKIEIDKYFNQIKITKDNVEQYVRKYNIHKTNLRKREFTKVWFEKNEEYNKNYYIENKEKMSKQSGDNHNKRRKEDPIYKFKCNVRILISGSFKRGKNQFQKNAKTEKILGCTIEEFRSYIEDKFTEGMTIENHGEWHLDHIIPLANANTEEEIIKLNHYTNFQPLWALDNLSKGSKNI
jgi:hypothetical protein